jgi:tetratricopeptide (TPR) repeat protein
MRFARQLILSGALIFSLAGGSQDVKIVIPAGSPEDKEFATIAAEADAQKRVGLYQEFLKTYADNKPAVAYAEWQLSQQYLSAGDTAKALEYGDQALALYPNNLDIIVSQVGVAQAMKDNGKIVDFAEKGAAVFHSISSQAKPADVSDADWTTRVTEDQNSARPSYEFLETAAYNAIAAEQDPGKRMSYIEKFTPAFPKSQFEQPVSQLALYSLQQLNQPQRLEAYGEKALAANPDSVPTLLMLANAYADDPKQAAKAITYANKVIALEGPDAAAADKSKRLSAGVAHSTLGYAYLKQDKIAAAIPEFKTAVGMLQEDPQAQQAALFRLGYAYAKQNRKADAVAALQKAAAMNGPYQGPARDMLAKVNAAGKK